MIYVMSDIHGYYKAFKKMLEKINFTEEDTLYIIGDLIDRGPKNLEIVDYCRSRDNIIVLKGNHEYMLEMYKRDKNIRRCWLKSGGNLTLEEIEKSYGENSNYEEDLIEWIEKLPLFEEVEIEDNIFLLTHAGLSKKLYDKYCKEFKIRIWSKIELGHLFEWAIRKLDYEENEILWSKGIFESKKVPTRDYLVIGHTPTESRKIENKNRVFSIDCGSYEEGGRIGCLCLNNLKEFYVDASEN